MIEQQNSKHLGWTNLDFFGKNPIFNISYYCIFIIPLLASILNKLHTYSDSNPFYEFFFHINIPYNWKALFFASVFSAIGKTCYVIFCPDIIKLFGDYTDFKRSGRGFLFIRTCLFELYCQKLASTQTLEDFLKAYTSDYKQGDELPKQINKNTFINSDLSEAFYALRSICNTTKPKKYYFTFIFYLLAATSFACIIYHNTNLILATT